MTKKKLMMAGLSAGLVAVVGVGGTLAYLSAQSNTVNNSFTVGSGFSTDEHGHTGLFVDELGYQYNEDTKKNEETGKRTEKGNDYKNLYPGNSLIKDPKVTMIGGSVESYVFVKVTGVDELEAIKVPGTNEAVFDIADWATSSWAKLNEDGSIVEEGEGNGYYVYRGQWATESVVDVSLKPEGEHIQLPEEVFHTIKVNNVEKLPENAVVETQKVSVKACAVQATEDRQGIEAAFAQAKGELDQQ